MHILFVSHHALLRDALQSYLRREGTLSMTINGCASFAEAAEEARKEAPDLLLIHHAMLAPRDAASFALFTQLCALHPVVLLGDSLSAEEAHKAMRLGAAGYVAKSMTGDAFLAALGPFMRRKPGGLYYTPRESEVYELLQKGLANKEIATVLDIAVVTVKLHVRNILRKAGCTSRARLLAQRG